MCLDIASMSWHWLYVLKYISQAFLEVNLGFLKYCTFLIISDGNIAKSFIGL
jgi:hypothetical protein